MYNKLKKKVFLFIYSLQTQLRIYISRLNFE